MPSRVKLLAAPPWMLADLWPMVGGLLLRGVMSGGETDPEFVADDVGAVARSIVDERHQLWLAIQEEPSKILAAFCTSILVQDDGSKVIHLHTMAGEGLAVWGYLLAPTMDAFARAEGARAVTYEGRKAWSRVLPALPIGETNGVMAFERVLQ